MSKLGVGLAVIGAVAVAESLGISVIQPFASAVGEFFVGLGGGILEGIWNGLTGWL